MKSVLAMQALRMANPGSGTHECSGYELAVANNDTHEQEGSAA